jgi:hypothetical protein
VSALTWLRRAEELELWVEITLVLRSRRTFLQTGVCAGTLPVGGNPQ